MMQANLICLQRFLFRKFILCCLMLSVQRLSILQRESLSFQRHTFTEVRIFISYHLTAVFLEIGKNAYWEVVTGELGQSMTLRMQDQGYGDHSRSCRCFNFCLNGSIVSRLNMSSFLTLLKFDIITAFIFFCLIKQWFCSLTRKIRL